jgi:hypothetical protein
MKAKELLEQLKGKFHQHPCCKTVYGEPLSSDNKTHIPVGIEKTCCNIFSKCQDEENGECETTKIEPVGIVEVTEEATTYYPFLTWKKAATILGVGLAAGFLIGKLTKK